MFGNLFNSIGNFLRQFVFWYVVEPWEQCLRVRAGRRVKRINSGFHLRIPYIDSIHIDSSRYRTSLCAPQTLTTADGKTVVVTVAVGHVLSDIFKLYHTLYSAHDTIVQTVASFVADEVFKTNSAELRAVDLSKKLTKQLSEEFRQYGLGSVTVRVQDFAFIKAFRLIQDQRYQLYAPMATAGVPR